MPVELARADEVRVPESVAKTEAQDPELAVALAAGDDRRIMELLLHAHGDHVYRYCRRMLGTAADSDDMSQTVFVHAFQCLKHLSRVHSVRGWLLRIARNRCVDRIRASKRDPRTLEDRELSAIMDNQPSDDGGDDPQISKALDECLDRLNSRSRAVLVLRFRHGLSFDEIAGLVPDTAGALRVRVARALVALRRCLERKGVQP